MVYEYCWAGMPILVTGPYNATSFLWAKCHPEAVVMQVRYAEKKLGLILKKLALREN